MWSEEYYENMQKKKYGGYSEMEARQMWQQLMASDQKRKMGPRGHVMFKIKQGDYESSFSELDTEEELVVSGAVQKKQNAKDVQAAASDFLAGTSRSQPASFFEEGMDSDSSEGGKGTASRLRQAKEAAAAGPDVKTFLAASSSSTQEADQPVPPDSVQQSGSEDATQRSEMVKGTLTKSFWQGRLLLSSDMEFL